MQPIEPVVRNLKFEIERDVPRHWLRGARAVTAYFDALSLFFPAGERFFMASVRAHQQHVTDPRLLREVRAFCGQEAVHGREHRRYNEMLRAHGYPVEAMETRVERLLRFVSRVTTKRMQLAVTCALEHFTALMAQMLLRDPRVLAGAHPAMAALWRWHAAEENEHKAVAYDVYLAAGGSYVERVAVMVAASVVFWVKVLEHQARMMRVDGILFSLPEWRRLVRFLAVEPGAMRGVARHYFAYYRPGFHPNDIDCTALLDAWKRELEASDLYTLARASA
jgi:predicted metal-dependent hydrolase